MQKLIALNLLIFITMFMLLVGRKKPGLLISYFLLFSFVTNIIFDNLGLQELRYVFGFFVLAIYLMNASEAQTLYWNFKQTLKSKFSIAILLIFLGMLVGYVDGGLGVQGTHIVSKFFMPILFMFVIASIVINKQEILEQMSLGILIWGAVFYLVVFFLVDLSVIDIGDRMSIDQTGYFAVHPMARMCAMILIAGVAYSVLAESLPLRLLSIFLSIVSVYGLIFLSTRAEIIASILVLGLFFSFHFEMKPRTLFLALFTIGVMAFFISRLDFRKLEIFDRFMRLQDYQNMPRYLDYGLSWKIFKDHILFGAGPGGYSKLTTRSYPHNMYLELMTEYGLLGVFSAILLISGVFNVLSIFRNRVLNFQGNLVIDLWIFFLLAAATTGNLTINNDFWIMSGVLISVIRLTGKSESIAKPMSLHQQKGTTAIDFEII